MTVSLHLLLAVLLGLAAVTTVVADRSLWRRWRRPQALRITTLTAAGVLVPLLGWQSVPDPSPQPLAQLVLLGGLLVLGALAIALVGLRIPSPVTRLPRRVVAIGAHPDDIELACAATLAKLVDSGHEVHTPGHVAWQLGRGRRRALGRRATGRPGVGRHVDRGP